MQFETVFEECVKIIPWVHWGHPAPSSTKASQTFGLPPAQCITFFEEDIKNLNMKKEIITPFIQIEEDIETIPIFNNINSQNYIKSINENSFDLR